MVEKMKTIWQTEWIQITIDGLEEEHNKNKRLYRKTYESPIERCERKNAEWKARPGEQFLRKAHRWSADRWR